MKTKICGIRSENDIELVNQHRPEFIGFIFYPPSPRFLEFKEARRLKDKLDDSVKTIGVFVNVDPSIIIEEFKKGTFNIAQLHGEEDQEFIEILKRHDIPVIKAIKVKNKETLESVHELEPDYFLFDIYNKEKVGGTGDSFDWSLLEHYQKEIPYFLAGGIDINNIDSAYEQGAYSLDISSGVETDYVKDKNKFSELFKRINELKVKNEQ